MTRVAPVWILAMPLLAVLMVGTAIAMGAESDPNSALIRQLRRPVALVMAGESVLVANRHSGTISVIDPTSAHVVAEHSVATRIAHMVGIPAQPALLVLDDADERLLRVTLSGGRVAVDAIANVPAGGAKLSVAAQRRQVFVTAKWSHCVLALTFDEDFEHVTQSESIGLPFAPQELLLLNQDRTLVVADAFGGQLAVVDAAQAKLLDVRRLNGHNIRGLAVSTDGKQLYVAHQQMTSLARADYEELHWGRMLANAVQVFDVQDVLACDASPLAPGWLDVHGDIGSATADPVGVITAADGTVAVALSGVGEVAIRRGGYAKRIRVGRRPEALAVDQDRLYVANRFDDTISIIDLHRGELVETVSLGPVPELTAAERGERLFFDARLSHDGWLSCHSCHTDGHSSGLVVDTLGDGDYGAPKRVPSLLGTRDTGPWGWNGSVATLDAQVRKSVKTTMHGEPLTDRRASDLVAYLESLQTPSSPFRGKRDLISRGKALFESRGCVECHTGPTLTSAGTFNVGLTDQRDRKLFNPPSLRAISQRGRFFHDARTDRLADVLVRDRHQLDEALSETESAALLSYLRSL